MASDRSSHHSSPTDFQKAARKYSKRNKPITSEFNCRLIKQSDTVRSNERVQELTINKLCVESIGLVGREKEKEQLQSCLSRLLFHDRNDDHDHSDMHKELVFIQGYSGIGKSSLANTLEDTIRKMDHGVFLRGKFDLSNNDKPYSGIANAFGQLCQQIQASEVSHKIGASLVAQLASDVHLLSRLVPELIDILPESERKNMVVDAIVSTWQPDTRDGNMSFEFWLV
mmetsp:Transcript_23577/g.57798  ORF Transcript_23577/g.57798 Transcript_23577/m.57798 type:complete len:227 (-) Transcript_23577:262-942(-)